MVQVIYKQLDEGRSGLQLLVLGNSQSDELFATSSSMIVRALVKTLASMTESDLPNYSVRSVEPEVEDCVLVTALPSEAGTARVLTAFSQAVTSFALLEDAYPGCIGIISKEK